MRTSRRATKTKQQHLDVVIPFDNARSATFRVDGLVALTTMLKAGALAAGVFYLFGAAILFCAVTLTACALGMKYATNSDRPAQTLHVAQLEKRLKRGPWRVDDFLYVVLYKLRSFVEALMSLHRSVVDYSFTVSIAESAHLLELHEQLFEISEQAQNAIDGVRTRAGSVATFQEDTTGKALVTFSPVKTQEKSDSMPAKDVKPKPIMPMGAAVPPPQKKSSSKKNKAATIEAPRGGPSDQPEKAKTPARKLQAIVTSPSKPESNKNVAKSVAALKKQPVAPLSPVGQSATARKAKHKTKLTTMLPTLDVQATTVVQRPVEQLKIKTATRSMTAAKTKTPIVIKQKEVVKVSSPSKPANAPKLTQSPVMQVIKPTPALIVQSTEMLVQEPEVKTPVKPVTVLFPEPKPIIQYSIPVETATVNKRAPRRSVVAGDTRVVTLVASSEKEPIEPEPAELLVDEEDVVESAFDAEEYAINFPEFQPLIAAPVMTVELVVKPFASKIVHKPFASSSISSPEIRRMLEEVDEMMVETNQLLAGQFSSPCSKSDECREQEPEEEADPCETN